jgi:dimethylglycine dehydrogenase
MLNENGKLIGDFTIAKAADDRFVMWGSSGAQIYHMRWFEQQLPGDGSVRIHRFGQTLVGLSIAGPKSRAVLQTLADTDVSNGAFRFMDYREMDVAGCPCRVNRISYTGDLGYEIWMEPAYQRTVYLAIKEAGAAHGIADFGMRALLSMRLEKNFPTWFAELRPIYGPFEGSMDRFIKLSKNNFIGKEAAAREFETGPKSRRVSLIIDADNTDVMGDEPIWARVGDTDHGLVGPPHGYGATRFGADGVETPKPDAQRDGDWRVVGWVTSGGYGHTVGLSLAQGYLPAELADTHAKDLFQVEILGRRFPARIAIEPPFDPTGARMRA